MLTLEGVRFQHPGAPALHADLTVARGEIVVLSGPSGVGKSTLIDLICGFLAPQAGDIRWDGASILGLAPARRPVSALFQSGDLFDHLDVATNVALGLDPRGRPDAAGRARVAQVLGQLGLEGLGPRRSDALSGGQRQRVGLARALLRARPVLCLDEPFAALDPEARAGSAALIRDLVARGDLACLVISHDAGDRARLGARGAALHDGRIVALQQDP